MTKRQIIITVSAVAFLALSVVISRSMNREKPKLDQEIELRTAVKARMIKPSVVSRKIVITGRLVPTQSVMLFAEVGGVASFGSKPFKEGTEFRKGDIILKINSDELQSSLIAGRSNFQSLLASVIPDLKLDFTDKAQPWENYLYSMDIEAKLEPLPQNADKKLKLFLSGRQVFSNYYNLKELETRLDKFTMRAPFNGSVVAANIDDASLVRVGQSLGEFISTGSYELEAGVSYKELSSIKVGSEFQLEDVNTKEVYTAKVVRINDRVDPLSQQVMIYAQIKDKGARSGIYLEGEIPVESYEDALEIPIEALLDDSYIFTIQDSTAILTPVDLMYKDNETAIIKGINSEVEVVVSKHNQSLKDTKVSAVNLKE